MRRVLVTSNEATPTDHQHTKPCSDCPWRRDSVRGWLGPATAEEWIAVAHSDQRVDCHVLVGAQCVGSAIFRANVCKISRDRAVIRAKQDTRTVFAAAQAFIEHHDIGEPDAERDEVIVDEEHELVNAGRLLMLKLRRSAEARRDALASIRSLPSGKCQARIGGRIRGKREQFENRAAAVKAINAHYDAALVERAGPK